MCSLSQHLCPFVISKVYLGSTAISETTIAHDLLSFSSFFLLPCLFSLLCSFYSSLFFHFLGLLFGHFLLFSFFFSRPFRFFRLCAPVLCSNPELVLLSKEIAPSLPLIISIIFPLFSMSFSSSTLQLLVFYLSNFLYPISS